MRITLALLLLSTPALADVTLSLGAGKGAFGDPGTPFERVMSVGYEHTFHTGVFVRPQVGYFIDNAGGGQLSSGWVTTLFGVKAKSKVGPELHFAVGPSYLQHPDTVLGGHFQFNLEAGIGLADENFFVGVNATHLSSGPIYEVNRGRDAIMAQVRVLAF